MFKEYGNAGKYFDICNFGVFAREDETGDAREVSPQHLPCINPFVHRPFSPLTGGGEVIYDGLNRAGAL